MGDNRLSTLAMQMAILIKDYQGIIGKNSKKTLIFKDSKPVYS